MNRFAVAVVAVGFRHLPSSPRPILRRSQIPQPQPPRPRRQRRRKDPTADPGVRKLSRRERKEHIEEPLREIPAVPAGRRADHHSDRARYVPDPRDRRAARHLDRSSSGAAATRPPGRRTTPSATPTTRASRKRARSSSTSPPTAPTCFCFQGPPDEIVRRTAERLLQPIEIWKYFYIPGFGHDVRFLFYVPRRRIEYLLWTPMMGFQDSARRSGVGGHGSDQRDARSGALANSVFNKSVSGPNPISSCRCSAATATKT